MEKHSSKRIAAWAVTTLLLAFAAVGLLLFWSAARTDEISFVRQQQQVFHALSQRVARMALDQESVTLRDTVVTWLIDEPKDEKNLGMMDRNFGTHFHTYYGHDESYVLMGDGRPLYAMRNGARAAPESFEAIRKAAEPVVEDLRAKTRRLPFAAALPNGSPGTHDVVQVNGHPAILSVKPVIAKTGAVPQEPGKEMVQISVMYLDGRFIDELRDNYLLANARYSPRDDRREGEAFRPFVSRRTGDVAGYFIWRPYSPGSIVLNDMILPLLVMSLLIGALLAFLFWRDVSRQRRAEGEIARVQNELLHVSRMSAMGTMGSTLAHELNQPLASVVNYVSASRELLKRGTESALAKVEVGLAAAEEGALRAGEIVRRLRDLVARGGVSAERHDLPELIRSALDLGQQDGHLQGVKYVLDASPAARWVDVDGIQIQQVLINLVRNATEAMEGTEGAELIISSRALSDDFVEIRIADTGPGIPADVIDQLFSPFESAKSDGLGIGLSICRTIIEAHGGHIRVANRQGGGAMFSFTVPRSKT